jgi:hypothetical protein
LQNLVTVIACQGGEKVKIHSKIMTVEENMITNKKIKWKSQTLLVVKHGNEFVL